MKRSISSTALLFTSVSAILGSGWLFSAYYTAILAGPSAIIAWIIGAGATIVIAYIFAELASMLPITGSSSRIPQFTHGTIVSFIFGWVIWLTYVTLSPTEVQAVIQYVSYFFPGLIHHSSAALTRKGYILATVLMMAISALNIFSLRWLLRCNNFLTLIKLIVPLFVSIVILSVMFSPKHLLHPSDTPFMVFGWHGVFSAISTGGIIFAFNGFKLAAEMAGEAKNPAKALPIAIIGSVGLSFTIYFLLQAAFLVSIKANNLTQGWALLHLSRAYSPFTAIAHQNNMHWLTPILYVGALAGPLAAALIYAGSASRALYGTSKNGYLPEYLQTLTTQGNPIVAIVINFFIGMLAFMPLPGWNNMVTFLTSLMSLTYAIAPICLITLRHQAPTQLRPFRLPFPKLMAFSAFYICTLMTYWTGWHIISKLSTCMAIGLIILFLYHFVSKRGKQIEFNWKPAIWIWPYFIGLIIISVLGNFGGGLNYIKFGWDFVVIGIFCVACMALAVKYRLPDATTQKYINELNL